MESKEKIKLSLIDKVKALKLPLGEYVVAGAGILEVLNIRETNDIDLAVTKDLHRQLRESGEWEEEKKYGKIFLKKDKIDVIPQLDWEAYSTTTEDAIQTATIIDGIPFMNLDELCKFKTALGRDKDFKDIELIREYQRDNTITSKPLS